MYYCCDFSAVGEKTILYFLAIMGRNSFCDYSCLICGNSSNIITESSSEDIFNLDELEDVIVDKRVKLVSLCKMCHTLLKDITDLQDKTRMLKNILKKKLDSVSKTFITYPLKYQMWQIKKY